MSCTGRFAPSPTGPLHFGSLLAALASYLDIRAQNGRWLVRIEDLDPPREVPGASTLILNALEQFKLHWDGEVVYQSQRHPLYQAALDQLIHTGLAYHCQCSRKQLKLRDAQHSYDGYCRNHAPTADATTSVRAIYPDESLSFNDRIQGERVYPADPGRGDFVIFRRDGFFAYQLAVIVDDEAQGIDQVVRGADLIDETPRQMVLQHHLGYRQPSYAHIPVLTNAEGQKLSKQTFAEPLSLERDEIRQQLIRALTLLGHIPPAEAQYSSCEEILAWAVAHWSLARVPRGLTLPPESC
ncbi:tRNA glutamyl-Q(34) synthetase GluQRS [Marinobacterium mangrovicola]|uniref:Glutamyl-Q tRNA(Asp) synthetase n=1 Tax=Marinobacterium mangrovicola TaxID=1476959 RepID=A0A4V6NCY2_9GAMM|nr:tRNA glutamyl-Q(34) synthetase GluQRS [Marinobacterium mangrovicola]TCK04986.1 glutamyl-Q tRNA(Asp) synthetase [Marinobacterium mangrovicola]